MKKLASPVLSLMMVLCIVVASANANMSSGANIVAEYVSWAMYYGIHNFDMSYSFEQGDTPNETKLICDRLTVTYNRSDMDVISASLLYYAMDETEEYENLLNRFYSFVGGIELGTAKTVNPSSVDPSAEVLFLNSVASKLFDIMEVKESSILSHEEVEFYAGKVATYYVTFQKDGVCIIARPN